MRLRLSKKIIVIASIFVAIFLFGSMTKNTNAMSDDFINNLRKYYPALTEGYWLTQQLVDQLGGRPVNKAWGYFSCSERGNEDERKECKKCVNDIKGNNKKAPWWAYEQYAAEAVCAWANPSEIFAGLPPKMPIAMTWIGPVNNSNTNVIMITSDDTNDLSRYPVGLYGMTYGVKKNATFEFGVTDSKELIYEDSNAAPTYKLNEWGGYEGKSPSKRLKIDVKKIIEETAASNEHTEKEDGKEVTYKDYILSLGFGSKCVSQCSGSQKGIPQVVISVSTKLDPECTDDCPNPEVSSKTLYSCAGNNNNMGNCASADISRDDAVLQTSTNNYYIKPNPNKAFSSVVFSHYATTDSKSTVENWKSKLVSRCNGADTFLNNGFTITPNCRKKSEEPVFSNNDNRLYVSSPMQHGYTINANNNVGIKGTFCEELSNGNKGPYTKACAEVSVPYNFENTASISFADSKDYVYAGESTPVNFSGTIKPKYNSVVGDTYGTSDSYSYATASPNTKIKVTTFTVSPTDYNEYYAAYVNSDFDYGLTHNNSDICEIFTIFDQCSSNDSGITPNDDLKNTYNKEGGNSQVVKNKYYNVYDANAGDYFCMAAAIYPASSGEDTNTSSDGDSLWRISKPTCRIVAKRPTFQVWGGSVYSSGGNIKTSITKKSNLNDISGYPYSLTGTNNVRTFGSWVEHGIVAYGTIEGLSSGAALGDTTDGVGGDINSNNSYCKRIPLTFANIATSSSNSDFCKPSGIGNVAGMVAATGGSIAKTDDILKDKETLINYILKNAEEVSVIPSKISSGEIKVYRDNDDKGIYLGNDITYEDVFYKNPNQIPKLILYTNKDVNIACTVTRIDAIIIAGGAVKTCANSDGSLPNENDQIRSNQLTINGIIIASSLNLDRTYGANAGYSSKEPAEIINYDSSATLWANPITDTSKNNILTAVYQQELPPRY